MSTRRPITFRYMTVWQNKADSSAVLVKSTDALNHKAPESANDQKPARQTRPRLTNPVGVEKV